MRLHGMIRTAEFQENPPGGDEIELVIRVQGVGPTQPRLIIIPFTLLLEDVTLDPENVVGRGFESDVEKDAEGRWVVSQIALAARVLRPSD